MATGKHVSFCFGSTTQNTGQSLFSKPSSGQGLFASAVTTTIPAGGSSLFAPGLASSSGGSLFSTNAAASTAPLFSLSTGTSSLQSGIAQPATSGTAFGFGASTTSSSLKQQVPSKSLGGLDPKVFSTSTDPSLRAPPVSLAVSESSSKTARDLALPQEFSTLVVNFRTHVKNQRSLHDQNQQTFPSSTQISGVNEEMTSLRFAVDQMISKYAQLQEMLDEIKEETRKVTQNAEVASSTRETPLGHQYENVAPTIYFLNLLSEYEVKLRDMTKVLLDLENQLLSFDSASSVAPMRHASDLLQLTRHLYQTFLSLAGSYQPVHEAIQSIKDEFRMMLRQTGGASASFLAADDTFTSVPPPPPGLFDPASGLDSSSSGDVTTTDGWSSASPSASGRGPSPFARVGDINSTALLNLVQPSTSRPSTSGFGLGTGFSSGSTFGTSVFGGLGSSSTFGGSTGGLFSKPTVATTNSVFGGFGTPASNNPTSSLFPASAVATSSGGGLFGGGPSTSTFSLGKSSAAGTLFGTPQQQSAFGTESILSLQKPPVGGTGFKRTK